MLRRVWGVLLLRGVWCMALLLAAVIPSEAVAESQGDTLPEQVKQADAEDAYLPYLLSMEGAFALAVRNNRVIQSAGFEPRKAQQEENRARSIYDPAFFMQWQRSHLDRPTQSVLDGVPQDSALLEDRWLVQAGLKSRLPTGASLSLYQEATELESSSSFVEPNPQYPSRVVASVKQPLLKGVWDMEGRTAMEVAALNNKIAHATFQRDVEGALLEIAQVYWELYLEKELVKVNRRTVERAAEVYQRELFRERQGLSKSVDVDRAFSSLQNRRNELLRAENRVYTKTRQLWLMIDPDRLMNRHALPEIVLLEKPAGRGIDLVEERVLENALKFRSELVAAKDSYAISRAEYDLARNNTLPSLDLSGEYGYRELSDQSKDAVEEVYGSNHDNWSIELLFEWPLGGRSALSAKRKAKLREEQANTDMLYLQEYIVNEVKNLMSNISLSGKSLEATLAAKDAAERVLSGEEVQYELGQKNNQDLLTVQDYYGSLEKEYLRALVQYNVELVNLQRVQGLLLANFGVEMLGGVARE